MKRIYFIILLILMPVALADVSLYCQEDIECQLYTGDSSYTCVDSLCQQVFIEEEGGLHRQFQMKQVSVVWELGIIEEFEKDPYECRGQGCLSFAPQKNAPLDKFFAWLLYA